MVPMLAQYEIHSPIPWRCPTISWFSVFFVFLFPSPYFQSLSIFASWAYFALYQLKFFIFEVYLKPQLSHEVFPWPHLSNHRYHSFTVPSELSIICILLKSTPQDGICFQFIYGEYSSHLPCPKLLGYRVTNHSGLPKMKCELSVVKLSWEASQGMGLSVLVFKRSVSQDAQLSVLKLGHSWKTQDHCFPYWPLVNWWQGFKHRSI